MCAIIMVTMIKKLIRSCSRSLYSHMCAYTYRYVNLCSTLCIHIKLSLELSCYYWCWCSVLGDLIILAESSSTSLGIGLSIALKAGVELFRWLWGAVAQWSEYLQLKQEALGSIPGGYPGFFSLPAGVVTNVDGMKDRGMLYIVQKTSRLS